MRIEELPHWVFEDLHPAFNDTESLTAIEMVSRIYGKIQELIDDHNNCIDELNKTIKEFIESAEQDGECFKAHINKIMHDYIAMLDEKVKAQDTEIAELKEYLTANLSKAVQDMIIEMKENGELDSAILDSFDSLDERMNVLENKIKYTYNEESEKLTLYLTK